LPKQVSDSRGAKKSERAFLRQHAKATKLAKRRQARDPKLEPERAGQGEQRAERDTA
jgi:hypothetical protein